MRCPKLLPLVLPVLALLPLPVTACSKPDVPSPAVAAPSASAGPSASAVASAAPSASAPPAPVAFPNGVVTCGQKGMPTCPLQQWMKDNTAVASRNGDLPAMAVAFDKMANMAPEYPNWTSISKDGAEAARAADLDAAKAACTSCHNQYRARYKAEYRPRAITVAHAP